MTPTKFAIPVPSEDPKKKKQEEKAENGDASAAKKPKEEEKDGEDLVRPHARAKLLFHLHVALQSEEDLQLKNELEMLIERLRVRSPCLARTRRV